MERGSVVAEEKEKEQKERGKVMEDTSGRLQVGNEVSMGIHLGQSVCIVHVREQENIITSLL